MAESPRVVIVEARFYEGIADQLAAGAITALEAAGAIWRRIEVPGAFELPAAIAMASHVPHGQPDVRPDTWIDGYVALGCVIRGETSHYDHVCEEAARGLQELAVGERLAIGFGLLTCETGAQARLRADPAGKDAGGRAARACLRMIEIRREFGLDDRG